jgi:glycosyltransferase involved in cell wall biosynthesis
MPRPGETLPPVRAGIDLSPLVQTRAGTARYIRGLLPHLQSAPDLELERFSFGGPSRAAAFARDTGWYLGGLPLQARRRGCQVLHCTTYRAPLRSRVPVVITVHDLAVLRLPEAFNRWTREYGRHLLGRVVRAARSVIAVSEFTGGEVVELLGVPEERLRVVPNAVDEQFTAEGPRAEGDYVLAVGTIEPRKNLARLAEAARRAGLELRIAGAYGWGEVRVASAGVRWLGFVDDVELARLYRGALCFAYPSLYEGFGIPVLEAMACGTPVVTSSGGALEELAGGAAVLIDPLDVASIAAGLEQAAGNRDELARAGLHRANGYTWAATAEATVAVYREAAA